VKDVEVFNGAPKEWRDWSFKIKMAVKKASPFLLSALGHVEKVEEEMNTGALFGSMTKETVMETDLEKRSTELFDVLCLKTQGEALNIVRGVDSMDGILAWQKLCNNCSPRTWATTMMKVMRVAAPGRMNTLSDVIQGIEKWEMELEELEKMTGNDANNKLGEKWKMAILICMMPDAVREVIIQQAAEAKTFMQLRNQVVAMVRNKITMANETAPMDIGRVAQKPEEDQEQHEVDFAGHGAKCYNCGGQGHVARACPSRGGGKAKGERKGIGRGVQGGEAPKGKGKGRGKGDVGKGGFQGYCNSCGKWGHRAANCWNAGGKNPTNNVEGQDEEGRPEEEWDEEEETEQCAEVQRTSKAAAT